MCNVKDQIFGFGMWGAVGQASIAMETPESEHDLSIVDVYFSLLIELDYRIAH